MKNILAICAILLSAASGLAGQGIEFFEGSWEEALLEAKQQEKVIFVDAYAIWCGPCKRMAANVFTHERVGEFYNQNFINVKMDMERGEGLTFRQKYPVAAFPTLFYIDYTGDVVLQVKGARNVEDFIALGRQALGKVDRSEVFAKAYDEGDRDPVLVYNYVKALNQAGKSSLKIANDYLRSQDDLSTEQNLRFILEATTAADSRIFSLLIEYRKPIEQLEGRQAVLDRIEWACENTVDRAIEFQSPELLEQAKHEMEAHYPERAEAFNLQSDMAFFLAAGEPDEYLEACKTYAKKVAKDDADELHGLARNIEKHFPKDEKCMKEAEKIAETATKKGGSYTQYYTYARILLINGKKSEALKAAEKSLEIARDIGPGAARMVEDLIEFIRA